MRIISVHEDLSSSIFVEDRKRGHSSISLTRYVPCPPSTGASRWPCLGHTVRKFFEVIWCSAPAPGIREDAPSRRTPREFRLIALGCRALRQPRVAAAVNPRTDRIARRQIVVVPRVVASTKVVCPQASVFQNRGHCKMWFTERFHPATHRTIA